jgi:hypothetical protein
VTGRPGLDAKVLTLGFHQGWSAALDQLVALVKQT